MLRQARRAAPDAGPGTSAATTSGWHDDAGQWFRSYGNENWEFDAQGYMTRRYASINDRPIAASERLFFWPLGRRPDAHAGLSELGL